MISSAKRPGPSRRTSIAYFIAATLALLALGYLYYRKEARDIAREKHEEIAAIGELKSNQIQQWRKERLAEASRFAQGPGTTKATADFMGDPGSPAYRAGLLERLRLDRMAGQYRDVLLFAPDGRSMLSTEAAPAPVSPATQKAVAAALARKEPVLSDFFPDPNGTVHIDAATAVRDASGQPLAVMVLRCHAYTYLFPLIQSWPTPSPSAETELAQRDGQEALYLNELRHRPQTALTLRVPLNQTGRPVVQALLGRKGEFQGKDYRGVEVLADLRQIPDSPWFMVAKVDAEEIFAEARYRASAISFLVGSLILLAGVAAAYAYRHQQAGFFRDLYDSERHQREAQTAFRTTLYSIGDGVITADRTGAVREMNPVAEKLTGWTEAEAQGEPLERIFRSIDEETRTTLENPVDKVLRTSGVVSVANHALLLARDGAERPIADSAAPIRDDEGAISGVVLVFSDQSASRAAQKELRTSEQRLRAIIETEPECVKLLDQRGNLLEMEPAGLAMLEAETLEEVHRHGLINFILPEFQAGFRNLHERVMNGESGSFEFEVRGLRGARRWLDTHAAPLRGADNQVSMLLGITRDVTERKVAETGLLQRNRQLAELSGASQQINTLLEAPAVMRQLVATALKLTGGTDGAAARLLGGKMIFKEYHLQGKIMPVELEFELDQGVPGWVMRTRAPYLSNDAEHDPHVVPDIQKALGFHNLVDVPVINRNGGLLGCFEIHNKPGGFNDTDVLMLQGLAASAAIALENADLLAERKRAEEALLEREAELQAAQRIAHVGSWRMDHTTNQVVWTEELYRMLGLDPCFPPPNYADHHQLFTPDSWNLLSAALARTQETGTPYELELEMVRPGRSHGWMLAFGEPMRDPDGAIVGVRGAAQDITERKQAKAALQESEERYRTLFEYAPDGILIADGDSYYLDANASICRMLGYARDELIGRHASDIVAQAEVTHIGPALDLIKAKADYSREWRFRRKDDSVFPAEVKATVMPDGNLLALISDISERKRADEALRASLREKESLIKEVHHRVKNNLQVITSLLRLEAGRSAQPDTKSVLKEMQNRIRSMALLHESLYRSENLEQVDLPNYITQITTHLFRSMLPERGKIQLHLDLAPLSIALEQAVPCGLLVNELVSNCLKHGFPEGRAGEVRIELGPENGGSQVRLRVSDTGVGLPPDFEAKRALSLGLQLVSDLVRQLKGRLEISGGPGLGTVFEVAFAPKERLV